MINRPIDDPEKTLLRLPAGKILDKLGIRYTHIENNIHQQRNRRSGNKKDKGFPDFDIKFRGANVLVEFKIGDNKLTSDQMDWKQYFEDMEYKYYVVRHIEEFIKIVQRYI